MSKIITHKKFFEECKLWAPHSLKEAKNKLKEILNEDPIPCQRPMNTITTSMGSYIVMSKTKGELIVWGGTSGCRGVDGDFRCRNSRL